MPTLFVFFGFRFLFYSNDHEPVHIHIVKDDCEAKYNVNPIQQVYNRGYKKREIALIESIIEENQDVIIDRWKTFFCK
ncbi:MAG: DUF4160 domain-containing protein [Bacteroidales bacterium]|nr:DUF4160 domain-containing protein [Bacteroidales bacterium]